MEHAPRDYAEPDIAERSDGLSRLAGCTIAAALGIVGWIIAVAFLAGSYWLFMAMTAHAHDALPTASQPLGWTYGWDCCSSTDCSQSSSDDISETPAGYVVKRTGEVIGYSDKRLRRSKDEFFHRCAPKGDFDAPKSLCLYVPDRGF